MIKDYRQLSVALFDALEGKSVDQVRQECKTPGTALYRYTKLIRVYRRAELVARQFGLIGVGAISFAEKRLQEFQANG